MIWSNWYEEREDGKGDINIYRPRSNKGCNEKQNSVDAYL